MDWIKSLGERYTTATLPAVLAAFLHARPSLIILLLAAPALAYAFRAMAFLLFICPIRWAGQEDRVSRDFLFGSTCSQNLPKRKRKKDLPQSDLVCLPIQSEQEHGKSSPAQLVQGSK